MKGNINSKIGPIISISKEAADAIINPNNNEYKFYFHYTENGKRKVEYSNTYEEHLEKLKR